MRIEKVREVYRKIKQKITDKSLSAVSLQIPNNKHSYNTVHNPEEIATHISTHNAQHFSQAKDTPFAEYKYTSEFKLNPTLKINQSKWMSEQINTNKRLLANISDKYKTLAKKFFHHIHQSPVEMGDCNYNAIDINSIFRAFTINPNAMTLEFRTLLLLLTLTNAPY
jgi:hypothetical protein